MDTYIDIMFGIMLGALVLLIVAGVFSIIYMIWDNVRNG